MNYQRFMVTGKCASDGKTLTGYLAVMPDGDVYIFPPDGYDSADRYLIADKKTIEPLALQVISEIIGESHSMRLWGCLCPNCQDFMNVEDKPVYCPDCGQRLDWSEIERKEREAEYTRADYEADRADMERKERHEADI